MFRLKYQYQCDDGTQPLFQQDPSPIYEIEETDFGLRLVALRKAPEGKTYVRVSSFTMPVSCWILGRNREDHFYVPADDTHAWRYDDQAHAVILTVPDAVNNWTVRLTF